MRIKHILRYIISALIAVISSKTYSQEDNGTIKDSIVIEQKYGLRVGFDLGKLSRTFFDENYSGFEINTDYRLSKNLYVASEFGIEEFTTETDYLNSTSTGSFIKAGIDFNMYDNWLDMNNMIYFGFRVGTSSFKHEINSFTIYNTDHYWQTPFKTNTSLTYDDLTSIWSELLFGIKAETFSNLYLGFNVQLKGLINSSEPENFENLFIPGFNRTYDSGRFGYGFGYSLSYLIPIYKKEKTIDN